MITPEQKRRVEAEVIKRLDIAMFNQGTIDPAKTDHNALPVYLAIIYVLDIVLEGNRKTDIVVPVRGVNVLNPFQTFDKSRLEFKYKDIIEAVLNGE